MEQKKLGIIGGLGPMASAQFLELLTAMTAAENDQEHIEAILYSRPNTPDRTAFLLGDNPESPLPVLRDTAEILENMGCEVLAIPCMTAYSFYEPLCEGRRAKIVHPIIESARVLKNAGKRRVGIMATDGTRRVGLFQNALEAEGIHPILPDADIQREVMRLIYEDVKSGRPADLERFHAAAHHMRARGAECVILGCTELSVIKQRQEIGGGFLDAMEVLAVRTVEACGYPVKAGVRLLD